MTDLERIQVQRADDQMLMFTPPAKRVYCACGCGVFWYRVGGQGTGAGRPRKYLNHDHMNFGQSRDKRERRAALRDQGFTSRGKPLPCEAHV